MANLHKTERKLPWPVRDGGLPSDWLGGRIGGNSLQSHSQTSVACQIQQQHAHLQYKHTHISSQAGVKFAFCYCVMSYNTEMFIS